MVTWSIFTEIVASYIWLLTRRHGIRGGEQAAQRQGIDKASEEESKQASKQRKDKASKEESKQLNNKASEENKASNKNDNSVEQPELSFKDKGREQAASNRVWRIAKCQLSEQETPAPISYWLIGYMVF